VVITVLVPSGFIIELIYIPSLVSQKESENYKIQGEFEAFTVRNVEIRKITHLGVQLNQF
jgi:hypothetical protein